MDFNTHQAIAALITGDATPDQQRLAYQELVTAQGTLNARKHEAERTEKNRERARKTVAEWPEWKREIALTQYSEAAKRST